MAEHSDTNNVIKFGLHFHPRHTMLPLYVVRGGKVHSEVISWDADGSERRTQCDSLNEVKAEIDRIMSEVK